ncbi:MAG: ABC transporter ATP-binding protein [Tumebacillaceae bacterium]
MSASRNSLLFSYQLFFRAAPWAATLLIISTILSGLIPGMQAFLLTDIVSQVTAPGATGIPPAVIGLIAVSLGQMLNGFTKTMAFNYGKNKMNTLSTELILRKVPRISSGMFEAEEIYDQLYRAKTNVDAPFQQIDAFHQVGSIALSLVSFLVYVQSLNSWLCYIFVASIVLYSFQMYVQSKVEHRMYLEQVTEERELNYLAEVLSKKSYGKEVRIFQLVGYVYERWLELSVRLTKQYLKVKQKHHLQNLVMTTLGFAIVTVFFVVVALSVAQGKTSTAAFAGLVSFIGQLGYMISNVGRQSRDYNLTRLKVTSVQEFLSVQDAAVAPVSAEVAAAVEQRSDLAGHIVLKNVSFRYPGSEAFALQGIDLEIVPGETIGIVGENGSGKTTLANLLSGLYVPTDGALEMDGVPYAELAKETLNREIGVVHQKPIRYEMSFRDNVVLETGTSEESLAQVLVQFQMEDVLEKTPQGLDTPLGKAFGTVDLSGGEWQRLAIARCFVRNPSVFLLDEPTSALDPENESMVFTLFRKLSANKTTVIISHRLGSIKGVDKIVVLKRGRIVEVGTHQQLMAQEAGEYQRLYALQAQWYQEEE